MIIPAYNAASILGKTLDAFISQDGAEQMEIIVVDDGSTDNTAEVARKYPVQFLHKPNGGPASARNMGVMAATGDIVLFIDCDCVPQSGWLEAMTIPFTDSEISGVKGVYITRQKSLVARFVQLEFEERYRMLEKQRYIDFVDSYSAAFRKEAFFRVNGFDESFPKADNEDVDLSYKLANAGCKMIYQPQAVVEHTHPDTLWKYIKVKFNRGYWRMAVYKMHPGKAVKDSYTPQTLKLQIACAGLFWIGLMLWILTGFWLVVAMVTAIFLILSVLFMNIVFYKDPPAALIAPFMLFLRGNCFLTGVAAGIWTHIIKKERAVK